MAKPKRLSPANRKSSEKRGVDLKRLSVSAVIALLSGSAILGLNISPNQHNPQATEKPPISQSLIKDPDKNLSGFQKHQIPTGPDPELIKFIEATTEYFGLLKAGMELMTAIKKDKHGKKEDLEEPGGQSSDNPFAIGTAFMDVWVDATKIKGSNQPVNPGVLNSQRYALGQMVQNQPKLQSAVASAVMASGFNFTEEVRNALKTRIMKINAPYLKLLATPGKVHEMEEFIKKNKDEICQSLMEYYEISHDVGKGFLEEIDFHGMWNYYHCQEYELS